MTHSPRHLHFCDYLRSEPWEWPLFGTILAVANSDWILCADYGDGEAQNVYYDGYMSPVEDTGLSFISVTGGINHMEIIFCGFFATASWHHSSNWNSHNYLVVSATLIWNIVNQSHGRQRRWGQSWARVQRMDSSLQDSLPVFCDLIRAEGDVQRVKECTVGG